MAFSSYLELQEAFRPYIPIFQVVLFDLHQTEDADLRGDALFKAAMKIAKYARTQLRPHLGDILRTSPNVYAQPTRKILPLTNISL